MRRFLNLASKALAVVGVVTLMWTASGMQEAKAQPAPAACTVVPGSNGPGWWACSPGNCLSPTDSCCFKPYQAEDGMRCCGTFWQCPWI
jgi:hypothetical protein